jgi:hypothetical protein
MRGPRGGGAFALSLESVDTTRQFDSFASVRPPVRDSDSLVVTGKSKIGETARKAHIARADARAFQLAPIVAEIRRGGATSWYSITMELNKRGVPTATGRGIWEQGRVRRVMERFKRNADLLKAHEGAFKGGEYEVVGVENLAGRK